MTRIFKALKQTETSGQLLLSRPLLLSSSPLITMEPLYDTFYKIITGFYKENHGCSIVFSSCHHGEGASSLAFNFSVAATSNVKKRILLVDGNLRDPVLHLQFNVKRENGLTELIEGKIGIDEAIRRINLPPFNFLASGQACMNPAALFASEEFSQLVRVLSNKFDCLIFDSSPLIPYPETVPLASRLDGVILVLKTGVTKWEVAQAAKGEFGTCRSANFGHHSQSKEILHSRKDLPAVVAPQAGSTFFWSYFDKISPDELGLPGDKAPGSPPPLGKMVFPSPGLGSIAWDSGRHCGF